jgi:hypothetical protein
MRGAMAVAVDIPELAVVELKHELRGHPSGAPGTIVAAYPEHDLYTIEFVDARGRMTDLVDVHSGDVRISYLP